MAPSIVAGILLQFIIMGSLALLPNLLTYLKIFFLFYQLDDYKEDFKN